MMGDINAKTFIEPFILGIQVALCLTGIGLVFSLVLLGGVLVSEVMK